MSPVNRFEGALVALLLGSSLHAQTVHEFSGFQLSTPWSPPAGTFGRSIAGLFTHNPLLDVVVLCGTTPFVLCDADPRDAKFALALSAFDIDVLPDGAPGGFDALVSVGPAGLQWTRFSADLQAFVSSTLDNGAWAGVRLV